MSFWIMKMRITRFICRNKPVEIRVCHHGAASVRTAQAMAGNANATIF